MLAWGRILIHHSAASERAGAVDFDQIRRHHVEANGWADVGYHFIVEKVGEGYRALMGRPLFQEGAHCPGQNRTAIGVCFVGDFSAAPPPEAMLVEGARLCAGLCSALKIPPGEIRPHRHFKATLCPGDSFNIEDLQARVRSLLVLR
jgi:hypothetical protein